MVGDVGLSLSSPFPTPTLTKGRSREVPPPTVSFVSGDVPPSSTTVGRDPGLPSVVPWT